MLPKQLLLTAIKGLGKQQKLANSFWCVFPRVPACSLVIPSSAMNLHTNINSLFVNYPSDGGAFIEWGRKKWWWRKGYRICSVTQLPLEFISRNLPYCWRSPSFLGSYPSDTVLPMESWNKIVSAVTVMWISFSEHFA